MGGRPPTTPSRFLKRRPHLFYVFSRSEPAFSAEEKNLPLVQSPFTHLHPLWQRAKKILRHAKVMGESIALKCGNCSVEENWKDGKGWRVRSHIRDGGWQACRGKPDRGTPPTPDPTESSGRQPDPPPTRFSFSPERGGGAKEIFAFCDFGPFIPLEPGRIGWSGQGDQLAGLEGLAVRSSSAAITHP